MPHYPVKPTSTSDAMNSLPLLYNMRRHPRLSPSSLLASVFSMSMANPLHASSPLPSATFMVNIHNATIFSPATIGYLTLLSPLTGSFIALRLPLSNCPNISSLLNGCTVFCLFKQGCLSSNSLPLLFVLLDAATPKTTPIFFDAHTLPGHPFSLLLDLPFPNCVRLITLHLAYVSCYFISYHSTFRS